MDIEIKFLEKEDINSLIDLIQECFEITGEYDNILKNINSDNRFLGAYYNNKLVGNILIRKENDIVLNKDKFHLDYVCVSTNYQNKGIGSKLLLEVEKLAVEEGISSINLTSSYFRKAAHHLYEKLNYQKRDSNIFIKNIK